MKILLPFKKDINPFLEEIKRFSSHTYIYSDFRKYNPSYKIVNIHWPEAIFDWREPTQEQLAELEVSIRNWKDHSILVYTKHDESRHKGMTPFFVRLFQIVEENTDVFIHLGEFSKKKYQKKYPNAEHEIIFHPLYKHHFEKIDKGVAREKLDISKDALVITVPGKIRTFQERKLLLSAFKKLNAKEKVLIAPNMRSEIKFDFRGRIRLKKWFDIKNFFIRRFKERHQPPTFMFGYERLEPQELATTVASADLIFVPRIDILNSGIVFLGLSFGKVIVGPSVGNIGEQLKYFNLPVFDPNSKTSVLKALEQGMALSESNFALDPIKLKDYQPEVIAKKTDSVFSKFL